MISGYVDAFLYALFTAISFTYIDKLGDDINPYWSLLIMSVIATLFFNAINYKELKRIYKACYSDNIIYMQMALSVGINWLCSIFAPNLSDPFIYLALYFMVLALVGFIFMEKNNRLDRLVHYLCAMSLILLIVIVGFYYNIKENKNITAGMLLGIFGGITAYLYAHSSNKLATRNHLLPTQVLAVRFLPLVLALISWLLLNHMEITLSISESLILLVMAIVTLVIPIYFLQAAINKLGVTKYSIFVAITPGITFVIYSLTLKRLSVHNLILAVAVTTVLFMSKICINSKFIERLK